MDPNKIRVQAGPSELKCPGRTDIRISTVPQSDESLLFKLENLTDRRIFIAYQPSDEEGRAGFLSNYLERRESGDTEFKAIEPTPHYGPSPHAIEPGASILFAPFIVPEEEGEYRVHVAYFEGESIYDLMMTRLPFDWSKEEAAKVEAAWKSIYSETFTIKNQGSLNHEGTPPS